MLTLVPAAISQPARIGNDLISGTAAADGDELPRLILPAPLPAGGVRIAAVPRVAAEPAPEQPPGPPPPEAELQRDAPSPPPGSEDGRLPDRETRSQDAPDIEAPSAFSAAPTGTGPQGGADRGTLGSPLPSPRPAAADATATPAGEDGALEITRIPPPESARAGHTVAPPTSTGSAGSTAFPLSVFATGAGRAVPEQEPGAPASSEPGATPLPAPRPEQTDPTD